MEDMTKLVLRLSVEMRDDVRDLAKSDFISMNGFILTAIRKEIKERKVKCSQ